MKHIIYAAVLLASMWWSGTALADDYPSSHIKATLEAAHQPLAVDLSGLRPGDYREVQYAGRPVLIYHRTRADMKYLASGKRDGLANPDDKDLRAVIADQYESSNSEAWMRLLMVSEPKLVRKRYRSATPGYLVVLANSPLGCTVRFEPPDLRPRPGAPFMDVCSGQWFDVAGRVLKGKWTPPTARARALAGANLLIPPYHFQSRTRLVIGLPPSQPTPKIDLAPIRARVYARLGLQDRAVVAAEYNDMDELQRDLRAMHGKPGVFSPPRVISLKKAPDGTDQVFFDPGKNAVLPHVLDGAIVGGSTKMVKMLLGKGARPTENSRDLAKLMGRKNVIQLLDKLQKKGAAKSQ